MDAWRIPRDVFFLIYSLFFTQSFLWTINEEKWNMGENVVLSSLV